ncbi:MAG: heme o synthase [Alphaproteobacteria bacterium]|nr:heme o synthase [Alphaproteobacteria bacterium]
MSSPVIPDAAARETPAAPDSLRPYVTLLKPRIMGLVVFTGLLGIVMAPDAIHPVLGIVVILCIAASAGGAAAMNMWYDRDIDAVMERTKHRPIPSGVVPASSALAMAVVLIGGSAAMLGLYVSWSAAGLLLFSALFYGWFYTMVLKRRTAQNIVIGGAAGAFPPVIAWLAVTGDITLFPLVLFAIVFLWTPIHFWALAIYCKDDYALANVPMYPNVYGNRRTVRAMTAYGIATVVATLIPPLLAPSLGVIYLGLAILANAHLLRLTARLWRAMAQDATPDHPAPATIHAARKLFLFTISYLFIVLFAMMLDHQLALGAWI